jgi:hypothetical protein
MTARANLIEGRQISDTSQMREATHAQNTRADVIDQLILDQVFAVPDAVEDFTHRKRRRRLSAHQNQRLLILRRCHVFEPKEPMRFCPTGEISAGLAADYLALSNVAAVAGSWMAPEELVDQGRFADIRRLAEQAAAL